MEHNKCIWCKKDLPQDYKGKLCEHCQKKLSDMFKKGGKVAVYAVGIIATAWKYLNDKKK